MEINTAERKASNDGNALQDFERSAAATADRVKDAVNTGIVNAEEALHNAKGTVGVCMNTTQQMASESYGRAKAAATNATNAVSDAAAYVGHQAEGAAAYVGHKAEDATTRVGGAMENTGHYLKNDGLQHMTKDMTDIIRRNPVPAMLVAVGLGFLIAQASTRRNA